MYQCTKCGFSCGVMGKCISKHLVRSNHDNNETTYIFKPDIGGIRDEVNHTEECIHEVTLPVNPRKVKARNDDMEGEVEEEVSQQLNASGSTSRRSSNMPQVETITYKGAKKGRNVLLDPRKSTPAKRERSVNSDVFETPSASGSGRKKRRVAENIQDDKDDDSEEDDEMNHRATLERQPVEIQEVVLEERVFPPISVIQSNNPEDYEDSDFEGTSEGEDSDVEEGENQTGGEEVAENRAGGKEVAEDRAGGEEVAEAEIPQVAADPGFEYPESWYRNRENLMRKSVNVKQEREQYDAEMNLVFYRILFSGYTHDHMSDWLNMMLSKVVQNPNQASGKIIAEVYRRDVRNEYEVMMPRVQGSEASIHELLQCIEANAELFNLPTLRHIIHSNSMHFVALGNGMWEMMKERAAKLRAELKLRTQGNIRKEIIVLKVLHDYLQEAFKGEIDF